MKKKRPSKTDKLLDGLTKADLTERLEWVLQVVQLAQVMKDWDQKSRIRATATLLIALFGEDNDEEQAELVRLMVMATEVGDRPGIAKRLADEDYMCCDIREAIAKVNGGKN